MCGIIYYKSFSDRAVNRRVLKHYLKQKNRGNEGFGFVGVSRRRILTCRATAEKGIRIYIKQYPMTEILFHHRLPTSTTNTIRTTHPILVSQPTYRHKYYLVHNGMIQNALGLKAKHQQMGITYVTPQLSQNRDYWGCSEDRCEFNDSEALAHELALFLEGRQKKIEAQGGIAFIYLETDRSNHVLKLHFARNNGSPLEMKRDLSCLAIASENVSDQDIPPHKLYTYDYRIQKIAQRKMELPECELHTLFPSYPPGTYWDEVEEIEMITQEYENRLQRIEYAQFRASARGDFILYHRLQREKEQIEEQLSEEWRCLEGMYFARRM